MGAGVALSGLSTFVRLNLGPHASLRAALAPGYLMPSLRDSKLGVIAYESTEDGLPLQTPEPVLNEMST